jgi:hypothetical protein
MAEDKEGIFIKLLREATPFEVGLVAFLFLPPILLAWIPILDRVVPVKYLSIGYISILIIYVALVIIMVSGKIKAERKKQAEELGAEERKRRKIEQIRKTLQDFPQPWLNKEAIARESGLKLEEVVLLLDEMGEDIYRDKDSRKHDLGEIIKLRSRPG